MSPIVASLASAGARGYGGLRTFAPETAFESIATATPSGVTSVTLSSIPSTYKHLQLRVMLIGSNSNSQIQVNGVTAGYAWQIFYGNGSVVNSNRNGGSPVYFVGNQDTTASTTLPTVMIIDIFDYASTTKVKTLRGIFGTDRNGSGELCLINGIYPSTTAISSITFVADLNMSSGTSIALYGIKG